MWTAWRTLEKDKKSFFNFLIDTRIAYCSGKETPSLIHHGKTVPARYREEALENFKVEKEGDAMAQARNKKEAEAKASAGKSATKSND
jgi:hypothetical protein